MYSSALARKANFDYVLLVSCVTGVVEKCVFFPKNVFKNVDLWVEILLLLSSRSVCLVGAGFRRGSWASSLHRASSSSSSCSMPPIWGRASPDFAVVCAADLFTKSIARWGFCRRLCFTSGDKSIDDKIWLSFESESLSRVLILWEIVSNGQELVRTTSTWKESEGQTRIVI